MTGGRTRDVTLAEAVRLDGRTVAAGILAECRTDTQALRACFGVTPRLAVVLVGDDPASAIYVRAKERACERAGVLSTVLRLPASASTDDIGAVVDALAADDDVHGIIVQLPLPPGVDAGEALARIPAEKDADGFHLYNVGSLLLGQSVFPPCTPEGVIRLLDAAEVELAGADVVVVGASNVVGKPMAMMALHRGATVTVCHAGTRDLAEKTRLADVLICAAGRVGLITGGMVKPGAVVVDVGINRLPDGTIAGDIDVASVAPVARMLTPVPGGVGPMTVAVLISNTVRAATRSVGLPAPRPDEDDIGSPSAAASGGDDPRPP